MTDLLTRRASAAASTINEADRSVEVVWTTEHPVKRRSWEEGEYMEVLAVDPKAIRMDRFRAGMSLLDSHDNWSMKSRLGTIDPDSVRIEGKTGLARVRFSTSEDAEVIWRDLLAGHPIQISVGYKIHKFEKTEGTNGTIPTLRATDWEPMELSVVPIPADPNAFSRSEKGNTMPQPQTQQTNDVDIRAERARVNEICALARTAKVGVGEEIVTKAIADGTSLEAFRPAMLDHLIAIEERSPTFPHIETRGMGNDFNDQLTARQDALVARMTGQKPSDGAREFMGASLLDHARGPLEAQGVNTRGMGREEILGYRRSYHTTSDFPILLQNAGQRVLQGAYELAASPLKTVISRQSTAADFRAKSRLKVSDAGLLEKVSETGEITSTTRSETSESYKIESYGRIFSLSFQSIVNDDLGAFSDWSVQAGRMAALTENKVLLDILLAGSGAGPIMGEDGKRLFHADHGNLSSTTGGMISSVTVGSAVTAFRKQKAFGGQRLAVAPNCLVPAFDGAD